MTPPPDEMALLLLAGLKAARLALDDTPAADAHHLASTLERAWGLAEREEWGAELVAGYETVLDQFTREFGEGLR